MQSLAIVMCTLLVFGMLLFGSDALDRRLTLRSSAARLGSPTDEQAAAAVAREVIEAAARDEATDAPTAPAPLALAPAPPAPPAPPVAA